jgi:hypothetical protein
MVSFMEWTCRWWGSNARHCNSDVTDLKVVKKMNVDAGTCKRPPPPTLRHKHLTWRDFTLKKLMAEIIT